VNMAIGCARALVRSSSLAVIAMMAIIGALAFLALYLKDREIKAGVDRLYRMQCRSEPKLSHAQGSQATEPGIISVIRSNASSTTRRP
jgi:hypothetical protein